MVGEWRNPVTGSSLPGTHSKNTPCLAGTRSSLERIIDADAPRLTGESKAQNHQQNDVTMNTKNDKTPPHPLALVALFCATASVGIAALAFSLLNTISDSGLWPLAVMASAPSLMGVAIAYFMTRSAHQD
jgi:hypothetical protein